MDDLEMALKIKAERKRYEADADLIRNKILHWQILETWRRNSPKMLDRLKRQGILDDRPCAKNGCGGRRRTIGRPGIR